MMTHDRCPRCGAETRYHRAGERVALCGWPLAPCATRMPGEFERTASEAVGAAAERPRKRQRRMVCKRTSRAAA